jgi:acid phosphatase
MAMNRVINLVTLLMLPCGVLFSAEVVTPRLANVSGRSQIGLNDNVMISGFIITGSSQKRVIVRGLGPSLSEAGVQGALANPALELHGPDGVTITNDDWQSSQATEIEATGLAPSDSLESAIVADLVPGAYTAILRGAEGGVGVGLVEVYDLDENALSNIANLSIRATSQGADNPLIAGVIITGDSSLPVTVRALGPSLAASGVSNPLPDPSLELYDSNGFLIDQNDNWRDGQQADVQAADIAPSDDLESTIMMTLPPGAYTAVIKGKNGQSGVALAEVYRGPALAYDHIFVVVTENAGYDNVIGSPNAPYINESLLREGMLFTNSHAVAHPSLPNYLALFAGSTMGVTNDNCVTDDPPNGPFDAPNLYSELLKVNKTALGYMESLPYQGYSGCESGLYVQRHNPFIYYHAGTANNVPYSASVVYNGPYSMTYSWPDFTFISPNLEHDMHDGKDLATKVANGDSWLAVNLPPLISYARSNNGLVIVTMDEDDYGNAQHIPTILLGDRIAAGQMALDEITHFNVTKTVTDNFGVPAIGETGGLADLVPLP